MKTRTRTNPPTSKQQKKKSNPKWIEALEARIAPAVTVISVGSLAIDVDGDGKADPLDQIHYNVTIQNTGPGSISGMSFQDIINDPNLTLVPGSINVSPLAIDDAFTAVGNTLLHVGGTKGSGAEVHVASGSLTANDFEFLGDSFLLTPITNGASQNGGTVNVNSDGTFTYIPAVGFTGTDSFTYTIKDDGIDGIAGNADDLSSTGTVTITVANKVWYVDSTASAGGDGRSTSPFNSIASISGATGPDGINDTIYVKETAGDYDGNITLLNGQKLIGSGVDLVVGSFTLVTATSGTTVKTTAANTNAITLAKDNTVRGFSVLGTTGTGILGADVGTLTIDSFSKTGTGKIIDLTGTSGNNITVTLDTASTTSSSSEAIRLVNLNGNFTATNGTIAGASGTDVLISGGSLTASIGSSITSTAGGGVEVTGHSGTGTITISGPLNISGGPGINVHDNTGGTISFTNGTKTLNTGSNTAVNLVNNTGVIIGFTGGGLDIDTTSGKGINATGGGTITVEGANNTINTGGASALHFVSTTIGGNDLTFKSISSIGGSEPGINLSNTGAGGLTVTGDGGGTNNGSGGTISGKVGASEATGTPGIRLNNVTDINLSYMNITGGNHSGIYGTTVNGFQLNRVNISGNGNDTVSNPDESGIDLHELTGTATGGAHPTSITNSTIQNNKEFELQITNSTGTLTDFRLINSTISSNNSNVADPHGNLFNFLGSGTANMTLTVVGGTFTGNANPNGTTATAINVDTAGGNMTADISGASFNNNNVAVTVSTALGGNLTFDIHDNPVVTGNRSHGLNLFVAANSTGTVSGKFRNNVIGTQGVLGSGSDTGFGIRVQNEGISTSNPVNVLISGNTIQELTNFAAINVNQGLAGQASSKTTNVTIKNNTIKNINNSRGIVIQQNNTTSPGTTFADISGNNFTNVVGNVGDGTEIRLRQLSGGTFKLTQTDLNDLASVNGLTPTDISIGGTITYNQGTPPSPLLFAPEPEIPTIPIGDEPGDNPPGGGDQPSGEPPVIIPPADTNTPVFVDDGVLSQAELDALVAAALSRWEAAGLTPEQSALLHNAVFTVGDLPGWYLGEASQGHITLDVNAAGNGWFVDSSPLDDSEYANIGGALTATINGGAKGRLDALTTIMHEFGHLLGLDDSYASADANNLMYGTLHLNERRLPVANQADGAVPHSGGGLDFLFGPVSLGSATMPANKSITIVYDQKVNATIDASQASSQISFTSSAGTVLGNTVVTNLDKPDVTVAIGATSAVIENSGNTLTYTFTRQGPTTDAWTANFNVTGTASSGDYSIGTQSGVAFNPGTGVGSVTFAAGQSTATVVVTITGDNTVEANETVALNVTAGTNYDVGTPASATGTITNDDAATISISGGTVTEGNSGTTNLPFTITLSNPVDVDTTVQFSTTNGSAIAPGDFTAQSAITVTIPAGQTSITKNVVVNGDNIVELDETFTASIGTLSAGGRSVTLGTTSATGTITNDDTATISIVGGAVAEGNSGTANLPFTVSLSKPVDVDTVVQFSTADITALAGSDYVAQSGVTVTIPAGQLSVTKNVTVNGDTTVELDETLTGSIGSLSVGGRSVTLGTTSATGTITNDDTATISISGGTITEGNSGTANLPFTVTLSKAVDVDTVVQFSTADLTALAGSDYVAQSGVTVTIPAGQLSVTQNVVVSGDNTVELTETLTGAISNLAVGGRSVTLGTASATATITNDDTATISIVGGTVAEGNSGTTNLPFTVILSNPVDVDTTVQFSTENGTAQSGSDYTAQNVTITIPAGQTSVTRNVTINGDNTVELDESFQASIGSLTNSGRSVTFGTATATSTITNDDTATVSITGGSISEGNSGTANLPFTITLSNPVDVATTVQFSTTNGLAIAPGDYVGQSLVTVTIPAGQTSVTQNVVVNGDNVVELDETFTGSIGGLSNSGRSVTLGTASASGTITNDDTAIITITGFNVPEGNSGTTSLPFAINLSKPVDVDTTVQFSTADLTAVAPGDYTAESLVTVTIPAGQTIVTHFVSVNGDTVVEGDETVTGSLSGLSSSGRNVTLGTASSTGTIANDDAQITLAVSPGSVLEDGTQALVYTFTRTGFTAAPLTVGFNVAGTATFNTDYTVSLNGTDTFNGTSGAITFAPNSSTTSITVHPTADTAGEIDETIALSLNSGVGYTLGAANTATGTIVDDDTKVSIGVSPGAIGENSGSNLVYTFTRTGDTTLPLTVNFTYGGGATFGSDYNQTGAATFAGGVGTVSIPAGVSSVQVNLGVLNDQLVEGDETAVVTLASGSGYGIDTVNSATGTITDNDTAIIRFTGATSTVGEAAGTHNVGVELLITADGVAGTGSLANPVSVNVNTLGTSTASNEGVDYTITSPLTVTFNSGATSGTQNTTLTIANDTRVEGDETINLSLGTLVGPAGAVFLGATTAHTVTIDDNDTATISLASPSSNVGEGAGTHNVGVTLVITANGVVGTGTLERNVTVNLQDLLSGTAGSTMNEGGDYTSPIITTLTFASGEASSTKNATISIADDIRVEGNETINLQLNSLNDATGGQVSLTGTTAHTVTVNDNDFATISLATGSSTVGEGAGSHNVDVVLTITANGVVGAGTLERNIAVNLQDLLTGTATAGGSDYNLAGTSTLTFASGEASSTKSVNIGLVDDIRVEGSETINLQLNGLNDATGGQVSLAGSPAHAVTITDNDFATISLAPQGGIVNENAGSHNIGVVLTITANGQVGTGTLDRAVSVNLSDLLVGNATSGSDYTFASPQTVSFGVGANSGTQNVAIGITDDTRVEGNEVFSLQLGSLSDGSNGQVTLGNSSSQTLAIVDNDTATISFSQGSSTVGEGTGNHNVGVTLVITANGVVGSGSLERDVTVNLSDLLNGSASAAGDYTVGTPQTITFANGAASGTQNVAIGVINDARVEGDETINLSLGTLSDPTEGQVSLGSTTAHTVTIDDNDTATISLANTSSNIGEGAGTHNVGVTLVINADGAGPATLERPISVNLQDLRTGTANPNEGGDYFTAINTTLTFASGEGASTKNATISLNDDTRVEGNETINLQLNNLEDGTGGQVSLTGSPAHTVTINDNDTATISLATGSSTVGEGTGSHNIDVVLTITANGVVGTGTLERNVTVNLQDLLTGTATAGGSDYNLAASSTLTFAAGESGSTKNVSIGLVNDDRVEGDETIKLELNGLNDGTAGQVSLVAGSTAHTVTITDNDFATISLAPQDGLVNENAGSHNIGVVLTITANGTPGTGTLDRVVSVNLAELPIPGATNGSDYTFNSPQTVSFGVGASSGTQNVAIGITDDTRVEGNESLGLNLKGLNDGTNGQVALGNSTIQLLTIVDNDTATISFDSATSTVGEAGGNHNVGVTLVITANGVVGSGTLERPISVTLTDLLTGTAVAPGDYTLGTPQTISFASGDTSSTKNVVVGVIDDNASEGNETINLQLGSLSDTTEGQVSLVQPTGHTVTIIDNDIDLVVTKTGPTTPVVAGSGAGNLTYVITVTNAGLTNATGVVLGEDLTLVPGVTIASITPSAGAFDLTSTPDGVWTIGNLGAGGSATLTVVLTVGSSTAQGTDIISDTATITASNEHRINIGDDAATKSTSVQRLVDLQLTKTDGLANTTPGSLLSYTLNVSNSQPSDANGVILTETVPIGTTFNAAASSAGWTETSPGVYTLNLGTVAGNSSAAPVTFAVTANSIAATGLDTITNTASVADDGTPGGDSTPANNSATDINILDAAPDLKITKTASSLTAVRGGLLTYTLTYSNVGNQDATGISITEMLPANTTFVGGGSTPGWAETVPGSGTYHFDVASLGAGQTFTVSYQVRVNNTLPAGTANIINTASIADDGHNGAEPTPSDNQSTLSTLLYQGIYAFSLGLKDDVVSKGGTPPIVRVYDIATGQLALDFMAYESTSMNGVRVAVGDLNGDGFDDIITAYARGDGRVRAFDGVTGEQMPIGSQMELGVRGENSRTGVFVASGDVTGDGRDDIIVSESQPGARIKVYDGITGELAAEFKPFGNKQTGVRISVGDLNGDGIADIVAGQQNGGNKVRVFEGGNLPASGTPDVLFDTKLGKGSGVFVAVGDVTGDGVNELIMGSGENTKARVAVYSPGTDDVLYAVDVFSQPSKYGVRVAAADIDLDGIAEIIASPGAKGGGGVWFLNGVDGTHISSRDVTPFPENTTGGAHVAGTTPIPTVRI